MQSPRNPKVGIRLNSSILSLEFIELSISAQFFNSKCAVFSLCSNDPQSVKSTLYRSSFEE